MKRVLVEVVSPIGGTSEGVVDMVFPGDFSWGQIVDFIYESVKISPLEGLEITFPGGG